MRKATMRTGETGQMELGPRPLQRSHRRPLHPLRSSDVVDVDYEHVDASGRATPVRKHRPLRAAAFETATPARHRHLGLFTGAAARRDRSWRLACLVIVAVFVAAAGVFWFAGGSVLMTYGSRAGGLILSDVQAVDVSASGVSAVMVEGTISNDGDSAQEVPLVAIKGSGSPGQPLFVRARRNTLAAGESTRFRVRLAPPARGYRDLTVTLAGGSTGR